MKCALGVIISGMNSMKYKPGQVVEGRVTGIQSYGAFVALEGRSTGLIHISEISDGYVRDIEQYVHVGEVIRVKVNFQIINFIKEIIYLIIKMSIISDILGKLTIKHIFIFIINIFE